MEVILERQHEDINVITAVQRVANAANQKNRRQNQVAPKDIRRPLIEIRTRRRGLRQSLKGPQLVALGNRNATPLGRVTCQERRRRNLGTGRNIRRDGTLMARDTHIIEDIMVQRKRMGQCTVLRSQNTAGVTRSTKRRTTDDQQQLLTMESLTRHRQPTAQKIPVEKGARDNRHKPVAKRPVKSHRPLLKVRKPNLPSRLALQAKSPLESAASQRNLLGRHQP